MDLTNFKTDTALEQGGVWASIDTKTRIKVARIGNERYKAESRRKLAPHKRALRNETLPESQLIALMAEVTADTVLLDWENLEENGKPVKYSRSEAVRILTSCPEFRNIVFEIASDVEVFRPQPATEAA